MIDPTSAKWCFRAWNHRGVGGLSLKLVNKVFNDVGIRPIEKFKVQLCGGFKDVDSVDWEYPFIVDIKYDGMRLVAEKKDGVITCTSRNGKNVDYIPEIIDRCHCC